MNLSLMFRLSHFPVSRIAVSLPFAWTVLLPGYPGTVSAQHPTFREVHPIYRNSQTYDGYKRVEQQVIRDQSQWQALWASWGRFPTGSPPSIDFDHNVLLAVGLGEQMSSCCRITLDTVLAWGDTLEAIIWEEYPDPHPTIACGALGGVNRPTLVVRIARPVATVRFTRRRHFLAC